MSDTVTVSAASVKAPRLGAEAPARSVSDHRVAELVREHYAFTWRVLRRFGLRPSDADDAAQQVFLVLADRLGDVAPSKEREFLFRTAMHVASKAHRSKRRRPEDADAKCGEGADPGPGAEELIDRRRPRDRADRNPQTRPADLK